MLHEDVYFDFWGENRIYMMNSMEASHDSRKIWNLSESGFR